MIIIVIPPLFTTTQLGPDELSEQSSNCTKQGRIWEEDSCLDILFAGGKKEPDSLGKHVSLGMEDESREKGRPRVGVVRWAISDVNPCSPCC